MRQVELTKGQVALVDDHHYNWVSKYLWSALEVKNGFYAVRSFRNVNGKSKTLYLHREIMEHVLDRPLTDDEEVDHIDLDKLNNLDNNLRLATSKENSRNKGKQSNNTSGFKGVSWDSKLKKWRSQIWVNSKRLHLGVYIDIEDAAKSYDAASKIHHGDFGVGNFNKDP